MGIGTPLIQAASEGKTLCVKELLRLGADPNKEFHSRNNAASYAAAASNCLEALKVLAKHPGTDLNLTNIDGETAFFTAAQNNHIACVTFLLEQPGIDIHKEDNDGYTPLRAATESGHTAVA